MIKRLATALAFLACFVPTLAMAQLGVGNNNLSPLPPKAGIFTGFPGNPVGTTNTSAEIMMGLGTTCSFTPQASTRVMLLISAGLENNTGGDGYFGNLKWGTGTAPANGAAQAGNNGTGFTGTSTAAAQQTTTTLFTIATGLTPGTPIWFDIGEAAITAGTALAVSVTCVAFEL